MPTRGDRRAWRGGGSATMMLSFSIPEMRPYVEAGIRQAQGEYVGTARVKRQTIRKLGPRSLAMLERAKDAGWTHPCDLHLWWKSCTSERELLGVIKDVGHIYPITILHSRVEPPDAPPYPVLRIDGPHGWRDGDSVLFWACGETGSFANETYRDGFDSVEAFRDFFVPNVGDVFEGALFKW